MTSLSMKRSPVAGHCTARRTSPTSYLVHCWLHCWLVHCWLVHCWLVHCWLTHRSPAPPPPLPHALQSVVPGRFRSDKQLVSHDTHNNSYNFKYTFSVEIAPVCKVRLDAAAGAGGALGGAKGGCASVELVDMGAAPACLRV